MIWSIAKSEVKNLLREKMTFFMLLYPLLLGGVGKYLYQEQLVEGRILTLVAIMFALITGFAYGAAAGFSLLDDRDDQVLLSIQISPVPVRQYIWLKTGLIYLLSVVGSCFVIGFMGAIDLSALNILLVSALVSLQTPMMAFLINSLAHNKVEGFVAMKGSGFLLLLPVGGFFFLDAKEWLFAIAPGHWAAKAVQYVILQPQIESGLIAMNLNFYQYISVGLLYNVLLVFAAYYLFERKIAI